MLIPRINRGTPDKIFAIVRNLHSAALADGDVVIWLTSADTPPTGYTRIAGVDVKQSGGVSNLIAGVMSLSKNLDQGDYGLCQIYGHHPGVKTTAAALAAGTIVTSDASAAAVAGAVGDDPAARLGVSTTLGVSNKAGIHIRCM